MMDWFMLKPYLIWNVALPVCTLAISGCERGPEIVRVSGKVTSHGGGWPKPGYIDFAPVHAADGLPLVPGMAKFDTDGNFVVLTGQREGLLPGEYRVAVRCWESEPGKHDSHKDLVPERFGNPATSGLELKVEPGSKPIIQNWDIPAK
jgi:hypothetical protein